MGVREVRRGAVSVRMRYDDHTVQLDCERHATERVVPLDAATFGRELVDFFNDHEACSSGETGVVIDVTVATPREPSE